MHENRLFWCRIDAFTYRHFVCNLPGCVLRNARLCAVRLGCVEGLPWIGQPCNYNTNQINDVKHSLMYSSFTNEYLLIITCNIMPLSESMLVYSAVFTAIHVVWLAIIPVFKDNQVHIWQPHKSTLHFLIICPYPNCSAMIANATSGF